MRLFNRKKTLETVPSGGWRILEYFPGSWQQNVVYSRETVLAFHAVFSCITLIAGDISKLRLKKIKRDKDIWVEVPPRGYEVIIKPNSWQNRIQFFENWVMSKLARGNAYILKERNARGQVIRLYVLNPDLVQVLVSESGDIFYQLGQDNLTNLQSAKVAPASEIIHDRFNCMYHPLVGLSPVTACGLSAYQGLKIQENGAKFFGNMSRPSGLLTAPDTISQEAAAQIKTAWESNYGGDNLGKVAVLGNDMKYTPMSMSATESQMVENLKLTSDIVCSTFHVPKYKVTADPPSYDNVEALDQQYFGQCLQVLIESIELCLKEGLEIVDGEGVEFDLDGLLRMDTATKTRTLAEGVKGGLHTPNEARIKLNSRPLEGGDTVYLQQQYYSLEALSKRDKSDDPFGSAKQSNSVGTEPDASESDPTKDFFSGALIEIRKGLAA